MIDFGYYTHFDKRRKPRGLIFAKNGSLDNRFKINRGWKYHNTIQDYYSKQLVDFWLKPTIFMEKFYKNEKVSK